MKLLSILFAVAALLTDLLAATYWHKSSKIKIDSIWAQMGIARDRCANRASFT
jgi:hypothetical protein